MEQTHIFYPFSYSLLCAWNCKKQRRNCLKSENYNFPILDDLGARSGINFLLTLLTPWTMLNFEWTGYKMLNFYYNAPWVVFIVRILLFKKQSSTFSQSASARLGNASVNSRQTNCACPPPLRGLVRRLGERLEFTYKHAIFYRVQPTMHDQRTFRQITPVGYFWLAPSFSLLLLHPVIKSCDLLLSV